MTGGFELLASLPVDSPLGTFRRRLSTFTVLWTSPFMDADPVNNNKKGRINSYDSNTIFVYITVLVYVAAVA